VDDDGHHRRNDRYLHFSDPSGGKRIFSNANERCADSGELSNPLECMLESRLSARRWCSAPDGIKGRRNMDKQIPAHRNFVRRGSCFHFGSNRDGNIAVSLKILDKNSDLVTSIDRNEFNIANHALLTHKPRPDKSTLVVFDEQGNEALYVRYLNKSAIYIRGNMYLGGRRWNIDIPGQGTCFGGFGVDMQIGETKSP
jgi:hypothetical protein